MTILAYHSIDPLWDDPLAVGPDDFEQQMNLVASMRHLPLPEYVGMLRRRALPRRAVAVTFDDGYANAVELAMPICERLGVRPAVFLAVGHVDTRTPLGRVSGPGAHGRPLSWEEVRELVAAGWTVGSHTTSHADLTGLSAGDVRRELDGSRRRIQDLTQTSCDMLSYPFGRHDDAVRASARDAGYTAAFTLPKGREHHDDELAIPRMGVFRADTGPVFRLKLSRFASAVKLYLPRAPFVPAPPAKDAD